VVVIAVSRKILAAAVGGLALLYGAAQAQQAAPPSAPATPPETKTFGDWDVRCFAVKNGHPCDMFQEMANKDSRQRILSFSLAYDPALNQHLLQITVPLDISLQKGLTISAGSYTSPAFKFRMCTRDGCFVQTLADNAVVEQLVKAGPEAKVNIVAESNAKSYGLQFSLKGFAAAHDDMVAKARVKATPAEAAKP